MAGWSLFVLTIICKYLRKKQGLCIPPFFYFVFVTSFLVSLILDGQTGKKHHQKFFFRAF